MYAESLGGLVDDQIHCIFIHVLLELVDLLPEIWYGFFA